jgi:tRNA threonylcarbamoyladenosine biosynthesis protein TsaE
MNTSEISPCEYLSASAEETLRIGCEIGRSLKPGAVVALQGGLGAGKTQLAKGIACALGVGAEVTSPTFAIISEYEGPFYHIDAYRLNGDDDFAAIGGEEVLAGGGVSVVEWSERIPASIPQDALRVEIEITGPGERLIRVKK